MHLQPAWAPKLQPASVCRQQAPGNPRARPHSPYLRTGARRPSGCGQARQSALQRQHRGGNRPSAPSPVAAEGPGLEVPSSGRAGAGGGRAWQALRPGALAIQRPPRPCSTTWAPKLQAPSTCWQQLPGNSQAGWRSQPRRTGARCRLVCGQARRSAPRRLRRGGNQTPAPSTAAAEGPRQLPRSLFRGGAGGSHGQRALRPEGMRACDSGTSRASLGEPASQRRLRSSCSRPLPATRAWERLPESRRALSCRRPPNGFTGARWSERSERGAAGARLTASRGSLGLRGRRLRVSLLKAVVDRAGSRILSYIAGLGTDLGFGGGSWIWGWILDLGVDLGFGGGSRIWDWVGVERPRGAAAAQERVVGV
ncbi:uncharacterized protein LOC112607780 [Theropithecus gelada]|uniref:uncharacterized protein LOC112607780 n=1 Tax=Theropithecus gelada TaxID=9565 RepID=UPI000DC18E4C|nr:uncharacterized protein LOC112607780 [Theropithecus gelada]